MNKEELLEEFDKRQKALSDEFISKLEDDKKKFELTYPKHEETLYYISNASASISGVYFFDNDNHSKNAFEHGLYFKTKEEAEQHLKERKLLFKIKKWAEIHNEGWQPNWSDDDEEKYFITCFDCESIEFSWEISWGIKNFTKLPYFKTSEIAQKCIDLFGDEIKEVLC